MTNNGWSYGICSAEPDLPKLLLLSLERVGVMDPLKCAYREYDSRDTPRCEMVISAERSILYLEVAPWIVHTTGFYCITFFFHA